MPFHCITERHTERSRVIAARLRGLNVVAALNCQRTQPVVDLKRRDRRNHALAKRVLEPAEPDGEIENVIVARRALLLPARFLLRGDDFVHQRRNRAGARNRFPVRDVMPGRVLDRDAERPKLRGAILRHEPQPRIKVRVLTSLIQQFNVFLVSVGSRLRFGLEKLSTPFSRTDHQPFSFSPVVVSDRKPCPHSKEPLPVVATFRNKYGV
jgi:hypothetical protein